MDVQNLIAEAVDALQYAYAPYSNYKVAAALLAASQKVYTGCNIENASFTPSNCAERTAFFKAVSQGEREFEAIVIIGGRNGVLDGYCPPCGVCRQVMMEFCNPKTFQIILAKAEYSYEAYTLEQLLPFGFGPDNL